MSTPRKYLEKFINEYQETSQLLKAANDISYQTYRMDGKDRDYQNLTCRWKFQQQEDLDFESLTDTQIEELMKDIETKLNQYLEGATKIKKWYKFSHHYYRTTNTTRISGRRYGYSNHAGEEYTRDKIIRCHFSINMYYPIKRKETPKDQILCVDRLGNDLCVDDFILFANNNKTLEFLKIIQSTEKSIFVEAVVNKTSVPYISKRDTPSRVLKVDEETKQKFIMHLLSK